MLDYLSNVNGWIGVGIGLGLFLMGYWKGAIDTASKIVPATINATLQQMIDDGYVRVRKVLNDEGKWEEEMLRHDEEV